jgi:hypothetical protein
VVKKSRRSEQRRDRRLWPALEGALIDELLFPSQFKYTLPLLPSPPPPPPTAAAAAAAPTPAPLLLARGKGRGRGRGRGTEQKGRERAGRESLVIVSVQTERHYGNKNTLGAPFGYTRREVELDRKQARETFFQRSLGAN